MPAQKLKRLTRAKHQKSKLGCNTCRIRRIRCDETWPRCRNCQQTGRTCDGVAQSKFKFVQDRSPEADDGSATIPNSVLTLQQPESERRSFDVFLSRVVPLFSGGALDEGFWSWLVPQLSLSNSAIWYTVNAIALLFEHPIDRSHSRSSAQPRERLDKHQMMALEWYGKAVTQMNEILASDPYNDMWATVTCALFVSIEYQQGNVGNALALLNKGFNLLCKRLKSGDSQHRPDHLVGIDEVMIPLISKHTMFITTFGLDTFVAWERLFHFERETSTPTDASPLENLTAEFFNIMYHCYEVIRACLLVLHDPIEGSKQTPKQQQALATLAEWRQRLSAATEDVTFPSEQWLTSHMLMYFEVTLIWVSVCQSPLQSSFDSFNKVFHQIVQQAEASINLRQDSSTRRYQKLFNSGCVPPLYFTAIKCRDPLLRRQALALIQQETLEDSVWITIPTTRIVQKIIEFEEGGCEIFDPGSDVTPTDLPPEDRRVQHIQIIPQRLPGGRQTMALKLFTFQPGTCPPKFDEHIINLREEGNV